VCGILGAYNVAAGDNRCLAAMSDAIAHPGSDAANTWATPEDAHRERLGHRHAVTTGCRPRAAFPYRFKMLQRMWRHYPAWPERTVVSVVSGGTCKMVRRSRYTQGAANAPRRMEGQA
jgi:hypothetical protein